MSLLDLCGLVPLSFCILFATNCADMLETGPMLVCPIRRPRRRTVCWGGESLWRADGDLMTEGLRSDQWLPARDLGVATRWLKHRTPSATCVGEAIGAEFYSRPRSAMVGSMKVGNAEIRFTVQITASTQGRSERAKFLDANASKTMGPKGMRLLSSNTIFCKYTIQPVDQHEGGSGSTDDSLLPAFALSF